ncbi:tetratricopeptide repeat protein [Pseudanabaena sp. PCC 6802]|uniref:tetratricopeptide repeat protein n=1 Tax=Pseudanabaena sp. PCC 6802 TaxID=118173 RepID=UPI00034C6B70|nr:tetratricopeptide repeat protein [Pseudanabaena sp. PCC 6802]
MSANNLYWYDGLELLLQGQEEEAQMVWISAIADGTPEQVEVWLAELVDILKGEAIKQEGLGNYDKAWLLRQHIQENAPGDIENLLHLIVTSIKSQTFRPKEDTVLEDVIELLTASSRSKIDLNLPLQTLQELIRSDVAGDILQRFSNACIVFYDSCLGTMVNTESAEIHNIKGNIYSKTGRVEEAIASYLIALELDPNNPEPLLGLGNIEQASGKHEAAIAFYEKALQIQPDFASAYTCLGESLYYLNICDRAISNWQKALELDPEQVVARLSLAKVLLQNASLEEAFSCLEEAPTHKIDFAYVYLDLGVAFHNENVKLEVKCYQKAILLKPDYELAYLNLAMAFSKSNMLDEAYECYRRLLDINPNHANAYANLGDFWMVHGNIEEAQSNYSKALQLNPDCLKANRMSLLGLPVIYESADEIDYWRQHFTDGLQRYANLISQKLVTDKVWALESIGLKTNFHLAYQGKNDLELQYHYGQIVQQVMAANYPQWSRRLEMSLPAPNGKIRIGYISPYFREHSVGRMTLGWIQQRDRNSFETYVYYTDKLVDSTTEKFQQESDFFRHITPNDLEACCDRIFADRLHVLVFTDIGMHPQMTQIAGLRLAPIQCAWAGHPVTTGIPTIAYYLSSDLMESDDAQAHYSEQLVRLPSLGLSYPWPKLPATPKDRADLNLPKDCLIYLSCQTIWKYLPQYDYIFTQIVNKVPESKIAFCVSDMQDTVTQKFRQRIESAFLKANLDCNDRCIFLPRMNFEDYLSLLLNSDVSLDTIGFSGSNTTLQAIACNLPVVTMPTEFLKGRTTYGILKALDVTDTIAYSESEYIDIAVRLGRDLPWNRDIVAKIKSRHKYVYNDDNCIRGLENFFREIVRTE